MVHRPDLPRKMIRQNEWCRSSDLSEWFLYVASFQSLRTSDNGETRNGTQRFYTEGGHRIGHTHELLIHIRFSASELSGEPKGMVRPKRAELLTFWFVVRWYGVHCFRCHIVLFAIRFPHVSPLVHRFRIFPFLWLSDWLSISGHCPSANYPSGIKRRWASQPANLDPGCKASRFTWRLERDRHRHTFLSGDNIRKHWTLPFAFRTSKTEFTNSSLEEAIVIHAADYVNESVSQRARRIGRIWDYPAIRPESWRKLIETVRGGTLLRGYYPGK
jgi:hypothetical protein